MNEAASNEGRNTEMSGIEMPGDEPQMMGGRQSQTSVKTILKSL